MIWTQFLVISFVLATDLGGVWETAADPGKAEHLLSGVQILTPPVIAGSSGTILPSEALICGDADQCCRLRSPNQVFFRHVIVRISSLADPYFSRAPPVLV